MNLAEKKKLSPSDLLAFQFLERAREFNASVELIKVLKVNDALGIEAESPAKVCVLALCRTCSG